MSPDLEYPFDTYSNILQYTNSFKFKSKSLGSNSLLSHLVGDKSAS